MPAPRARPDEHRDVRAVEGDARVVGDLDIGEQRERAVLQLERRALRALQALRDLQQAQAHRAIGPQHGAGGDAEQQRVADLSARSGHGDGRGIHASSLRRRVTGRYGEA
jgi:hypothetical protein